MKIVIENMTISARYTGTKKAPWKNADNWNHHYITFRNNDSGKSCRFDFWESIMHPVIDNEIELAEAAQCVVSDALLGLESFNDFCFELGYDNDSISALNVWKSCKRTFSKLNRVFNLTASSLDGLRELLEAA